MPELPEVETIVRDLRQVVLGRCIAGVRVLLPKIVRTGAESLPSFLTGLAFTGVRRMGKFIVLELPEQKRLVVHLKMTGKFLMGRSGESVPKYAHIAIGFEDGETLYYCDIRQFGRFYGLTGEVFPQWLAEQNLGPDPFRITMDEFVRRLRSKKSRIKPLLLNQTFVSGLGNIYVDESLFAAGIHPLTHADRISKKSAEKLYGAMIRILSEAIERRGSTTRNYVGLTGVGGEFQNCHLVYGKTGEACPACGESVVRIVVGGRGTHFCPQCQPCKT